MMWSILNFGKHSGKSLPQVIFSDPDWFFWAYSTNIFDSKGFLKVEADNLYRKSRSIKIPDNQDGELEIEYIMDSTTLKFSGMEIVPKSQPLHTGSSPASRKDVIDLGIVSDFANYDKLGGRILISQLKSYVFENQNQRMTKKKCEDFFNTEDNFI